MISGFKPLDIQQILDINENEINDYDQILFSEDSILLIKKYDSLDELIENWKNQVYFAGGYIQANFEKLSLPDCCLWNTYIIYLADFIIPINIKLQIEMDKYVCKKFVVNITNSEDYYMEIVNYLPALSSEIFNKGFTEINKDDEIRKLFVCVDGIDDRISNFIMDKENIFDISIESIIQEMVGTIDE